MNAASAPGAIELRELVDLATSPLVEAVSPFGEAPYVVVYLDAASPRPGAKEEAAIVGWLRRQSGPVMAVAEGGAHERLQQACDLSVDNAATLGPLIENIRRSPLAAMVLVQVLRATEQLPIEQALVVESLAYATLQGGAEFRRWLDARPARSRPRATDPGPPVVVERNGANLEIRLNRPSRRNSMSVEMRDGLCEALQLVAADPSIDTARVSGLGQCFSSGGDLDEFGTAPDTATAHAVRSLRLPASVLLQCVERVEFRLHGACVGAGAELPAFGRRVHATPDAFFQLPEIRLGLIPGAGGCVSIPRRIGRQRMAYMALSSARIDAPQALAWGLVDAIGE
ncbi:MAG TPA: enoyl-CoA hydratase/isomerase family protein [Steroidobacteraceae bacterium]|nr:enoyl-CoA hydratase/isomerase family protein [Steroidobacteraceae bacterium]